MDSMSPARQEPPASPWTVALGGCLALAVAMGVGRFAFTPLLPIMQEHSGLGLARGSGLASANYVGYFVGALMAAALRTESALGSRASLVSVVVLTLGMAATNEYSVWLVLRFLAGLASAFALVHVSSYCLESLGRLGRVTLAGLVFGGVGLGITLVGLLCLWLVAGAAGSARAWGTVGAAALLLTGLAWPAFRSSSFGKAASSSRSALRLRGESLRLVLVYGGYGFGYIIPATYLPLMARQASSDPVAFAWSWPIFGMAAFLSTVLAGGAGRFIDDRRLWAISQVVMAVGVAAPVYWSGLGGILVAAVAVGSMFMVTSLAGLREARRLGATNATSLVAAMTAAFALGQIAGPVIVGLLPGAHGFAVGSLLAAAVLLLGAAVLLRSPAERSPVTPPAARPEAP